MEKVLKHSLKAVYRWGACIAAVMAAVFVTAGPLGAQSMMEYTVQQSASQAVAQKALSPARTTNNYYAGQVLESQNTAAGRFLREQLPSAIKTVQSFFVDPQGQPIWKNVVAALLLLLVVWRFARPS